MLFCSLSKSMNFDRIDLSIFLTPLMVPFEYDRCSKRILILVLVKWTISRADHSNQHQLSSQTEARSVCHNLGPQLSCYHTFYQIMSWLNVLYLCFITGAEVTSDIRCFIEAIRGKAWRYNHFTLFIPPQCRVCHVWWTKTRYSRISQASPIGFLCPVLMITFYRVHNKEHRLSLNQLLRGVGCLSQNLHRYSEWNVPFSFPVFFYLINVRFCGSWPSPKTARHLWSGQ